jgi:hypothetical protein
MKHGWAFMDAITRAIEGWCGDLARRHPGAFQYRRADLRHAVERTLFFRLANDAELQQCFDALVDGAPLPPKPADAWCAAIMPYLSPPPTDQAIQPDIPALDWKRRLRRQAGNLSRIGRPSCRSSRLKGDVDILLLAIHPKFVSFLLPIADAVGTGVAFLTINDPALEAHLAEQQLPGVALRSAFSWPSPAGNLLGHFPEICSVFDRLTAMVNALKPRAILVPEGNAPVYEIANRAGQQHGVATICIQHGAPAYTNPGFRNWSFSDVFVWGEAFIEPYARHNPRQHFTVTGTPALLPFPRMRAADAPINSAGFFLQKGATVIPQNEWEALLRFIGSAAAAFPDIEIVVRDHPTQPHLTGSERAMIGNFSNVRFMSPPHYSLNDALGACDIVIAAASTTLLEAVQSSAIPFIFGTAYPEDFPDIAGAGAAVAARDVPAAETVLRALIEDRTLRSGLRLAGDRLRPSLFAASGAQGAARIVAALGAAASGRRPP